MSASITRVRTAGQVVEVSGATGRLDTELRAALGRPPRRRTAPCDAGPVSLRSEIVASLPGPGPDDVVVTRGVWRTPAGEVLLAHAGGSGWAQRWRLHDRVEVRSAWQPRAVDRAAAIAAPARRRALQAQVLVHHPALWAAAAGGLVPLHVSVVEVDGLVVVLAGPGGVGKSTLVATALRSGARAWCDNLAVSDGRVLAPVAEPLRLDASVRLPEQTPGGRRAMHGRREHLFEAHGTVVEPDLLVLVRRADPGRPTAVTTVPPERVRDMLVAGTYAAGELQRLWPLAAQLALATGRGPGHLDVAGVAARLVAHRPTVELALGAPVGARLAQVLAGPLAEARTAGGHTGRRTTRSGVGA
ncbi:hypothetical protein GCM10027425_15660 [Alteromonas gracilis]